MEINVIKQILQSKLGAPNGGEDRIVVTSNMVAVIDGATSKSGEKFDGKTGGALVADAAVNAIRAMAGQNMKPYELIDKLTEAVKVNVLDQHDFSDGVLGDRPAAHLVAFIADPQYKTHHIVRLSDGHFAVQRPGQSPTISYGGKEIDKVHSRLRAAHNRALRDRENMTDDELRARDIGREIIQAGLVNQPLHMNNPYPDPFKYAVLDGRPVPTGLITVAPITHVPGTRYTLTSDGILKLCTLNGMIDVRASFNHQAEYIKRDPLRIQKYLSTKGAAPGQPNCDDVAIIQFEM